MHTLRFVSIILTMFSALACFSPMATATEQTYVREYTYQANQLDTKISARAIALQEVKRALLNELGTHVSSLVKINTSSDGTRLATEEIETLSAGVTRVLILEENWDGSEFVLKAQIKADPAEVLESLEKMLDADKKQKQVSQLEGDVSKLRIQNINISESLTQSKKETTSALAEITRLRMQLEKQQTVAARQTLQTEYRYQVDNLMSNERIESALEYFWQGDYSTAITLFKTAADQSDADAQYLLGWMYYMGEGVRSDLKQAVYWFEKAAEQNLAEAQYALGTMYYLGEGVAKNFNQGIIWFKKASEQGHPIAQFNLGHSYHTGQGISQNYTLAAFWFRKAAEQGKASAQYNLSRLYLDGEGVPQDAVQSVYWLRKSAEQGFAEAQYALGFSYAGGHNVPQDYVQAAFWFRKAADQDYAKAQFDLGSMYRNGQGVPKDDAQAFAWTHKAAVQGHAGAQGNLGLMYASGRGIPQNSIQAYAWLNVPANQGDIKAALYRDKLLPHLTPDQIKNAQQISQDYLTKYGSKIE